MPEDVPAAAKLAGDAFLDDRQTQMKNMGKEGYDMNKMALESLPNYLTHPRCAVLKAVDNATGEVAGFCNWASFGFPQGEGPVLAGRLDPIEPKKKAEEVTEEKKGVETALEDKVEDDPVKRLEAMEDKDLNDWMKEIMPEGTQCLYVVGLIVGPKFQGRAIGSALLRWGTKFCDEKGCFAWVHSSEPAWKMYEKSGFEVIRLLDVDLDEWAPGPPPDEGPDAKWGHYELRYMKYFGKKT